MAANIARRFLFLYVALYSCTIALTQIPGFFWTGYVWLWLATRAHLPFDNGDSADGYHTIAYLALAAAVGSVAWAALSRVTPSHEALRVMLRHVLAGVMLGYGITKLFGGQFPPPNAHRLSESFGEASPMGLLWTFMGYSRAYVVFSGLAETIGASLLLWRRTATFGALILAAVLLNVAMLNLCYDVPVKINSLHYLAMTAVLVWPEVPRLLDFFVRHRAIQPAAWDLVIARRWQRMARIAAKYSFITLVVVAAVREAREELSQRAPVPRDAPLMQRGFHWVNEEPFNR